MNMFFLTVFMSLVWEVFILVFTLQILFFLIWWFFKTDKVTDISYACTFLVAVMYLYVQNISVSTSILFLMITLWSLRLGMYLWIRIFYMGKDNRFDSVREDFVRFFLFWLYQAITICIILLPSIFFIIGENSFRGISIFGMCIFVLWLVIESVADYQKYGFKTSSKNRDHWVDIGLWKHARHPNYFGEILIWWGVFIFCMSSLSGWEYVTIISPIYVVIILVFVSGIPPLQKRYDQKYGHNPKYQQYKEQTFLLVPVPKSKIALTK